MLKTALVMVILLVLVTPAGVTSGIQVGAATPSHSFTKDMRKVATQASPPNASLPPARWSSYGSIIGNLSVGAYPWGLAVDSNNGDIYVANDHSNNVSVISGSINTVIGSIPVGSFPIGVAFDSATNTVLVANYLGPNNQTGTGNLTVIDGSTNLPVGSVTIGSPRHIAWDASNGYLYVTNGTLAVGGLSVVNGVTDKIVGNISLGPYTDAFEQVALDPANG